MADRRGTPESSIALAVNGVDATTGGYLLPGLTLADLAAAAQHSALDDPPARQWRARHRRASEPHYGARHGIDADDLGQAGWGVLFAADADPAPRTALRPLLQWRRAQAGARVEHRYRELHGPDGYRRGETKQEFSSRHGSAPGPVDPDRLPYYLLLVGGPAEIPFEVQYQLGVQHAVGRIAFDDVADYRRYAENVVSAESTARSRPLRLSVFAPRNDDDLASTLSATHLAAPLGEHFAAEPDGWQVRTDLGADATRDRLAELLTGSDRPDVLYAAAHGVGLPCGHPDQRRVQGALLCQDWPGPRHGPVEPAHRFGAPDVARLGEADLTGMVAFLVACFGAGTPRHDDFHRSRPDPVAAAPDPFVAALPQALLGREGGAQAVVGSVDRSWSCAFLWPGAGRQIEVQRSTLARLGSGSPLGPALEYVHDRHAELVSDLGTALRDIRLGRRPDHQLLAQLWTACVDARNVVLLGDPAVRATGTARPATPAEPTPIVVRARPEPGPAATPPGEIATFLADDPHAVDYDPDTGRIIGATAQLVSRIGPEGSASHVVAPTFLALPPADREALLEVHLRLLTVRRPATDVDHGR